MITLKNCPVCNSSQIAQYEKVGAAPYVTYEIMPNTKIGALIISLYCKCKNCNLIFQNPRLSNSELDKFYGQGYYRKIINLSDKQKDDDEMNRAMTDSDLIKKNVGAVQSHLDVGCSRGYLLEKVGANLQVGVESDLKGVKAKGIKVYETTKKVLPKKFDLVTMIHTLEHVTDPVNYIKEISKFLKDSSYLVIEVPTWKSPGGPLRLPHLYHFEPDVLKTICQNLNLKVVHTEFTPHLMLICKLN